MYHQTRSTPQNLGKYTKTTTFTSVHSNNVSNGIDESALHYQVRNRWSRVWLMIISFFQKLHNPDIRAKDPQECFKDTKKNRNIRE